MTAKQENKDAIIDRVARPCPEWLKRSVMYQIFLRAFTVEGTLKAAEKRLPRLAELGVDIVYLCPICLQDDDMRTEFWSKRQKSSQMNNPKNPYRIKDYYQLDHEYGSENDLREFVATAHGLNIRVLLDVVYFHCGPTAKLIIEHPDSVSRSPEGEPLVGEWHFPVLNFESLRLREHLWENMEYWVRDFGVDGYRCDASDHVPLDFWEEGRRRLEKINAEVILLAESYRPDDQLRGFDLNYSHLNYAIGTTITEGKPASGLRTVWEDMRAAFPRGARFVRFIDNHDLANDSSERRTESVWGAEGTNAALVLIFTLDGVPYLYNGQEIADKAQHSIFAKLTIDWPNAARPEGQKRFALCRRLCELRHTERALTEGEVIWLENGQEDAVISFERKSGSERMLVVVNLSHSKVDACLKAFPEAPATLRELLSSGASLAPSDAKSHLRIGLEGLGYFVGKL